MNSPKMILELAAKMKEKGIVPELEVFNIGMINYAKYLEKKGLITAPFYFNLLFGNIACSQANLLHTGVMLNDLPEGALWSLAGIGNEQLKMNSLAIAFGEGVRVGLEDNIWWDSQRTRLTSNIELLHRIHQLAEVNYRSIMNPREFRKKMQMEPGNGKYGKKIN